MITSLFLIVAILLALIISIFNAFKVQIILFLVVVLILVIAKTVKQVRKYGWDNVFSAFREREMPCYRQDIVKLTLESYKGKRYFFHSSLLYSDYVIVDKSGIYCVKIIDIEGVVSGNIEQDVFMVKNIQQYDIPNFFKKLDHDQDILSKLCHGNVIPVIVKDEASIFSVVFPKKYVVMNFKEFYHGFQILFQKSLYSEEEMDEIYMQLQSLCK